MSNLTNEQCARNLREIKVNQRSIRKIIILNTKIKISEYLSSSDTTVILNAIGKREKGQLEYLQCVISILEVQERINRIQRINKKVGCHEDIEDKISEYKDIQSKLLKDLKKRHRELGFGKFSITNFRKRIRKPESLKATAKKVEDAFSQEGKIIALND